MESRFATPYVSVISWQLNKVNVQDVQQTQAGPRTSYYEQDPYISFNVTNYLANRDVGTLTYTFPKELKDGQVGVTMSQLLESTKSNVLQTWSTVILDEMANVFPVLADQAEYMAGYGTKVNLRLDGIKAVLPFADSKCVIATIGIYLDDNFAQPTKYLELVFADGNTLRAREAEKVQLTSAKVDNQAIIDNNEATDQQKAQAVSNVQAIDRRLAEMEAQLVGNLVDLLGKASVIAGSKDLVQALFTTLKANDSRWSNINVEGLMSLFTLPDVS